MIKLDKASWQAGYDAAMKGDGEVRVCPDDIPDKLAFWSGAIEGAAKRLEEIRCRRSLLHSE